MTNPQQYALPPDSTVDIAFKHANTDYNLHINTHTGLISLQTIEEETNKDHLTNPIFIKLLS